MTAASWKNVFTVELRDDFDQQDGALTPLEDHNLIVVDGEDAVKFLQGQCTCDLNHLESSAAVMGAHCTPKGRMTSSFVGAKISETAIGLRVHASIAESALEALKKYAVFSKVRLSISNEHFIFAHIGKQLNSLPEASHTVGTYISNDSHTTLNLADNQTEYWCRHEHLESLLHQLKGSLPQTSSRLWWLNNIRRGVAEVEDGVREKLIPQEINYQFTDGISFSKGCYTGQEIIARLHYRGKLKKHMRRAEVQTDKAPRSGDPIFEGGNNVGTIINVAQNGVGRFELLALCEDASYEASQAGDAQVRIEQDSSPNLKWLALPYAIN